MSRRGQANMESYKLKQNCAVIAFLGIGYVVLVSALAVDTLFG